MPKGEYDTPGPFYQRGPAICHRNVAAGRSARAMFAEILDRAEREELVGLLNKGTHFERMLEALKGMSTLLQDASAVLDIARRRDAVRAMEDAIAEAEGSDHE